MQYEVKTKLESLKVNLDETLERFVFNEDLYFRCLSKFKDDENYRLMLDAVNTGNASDAFEAAHALKGICANLGLNELFEEVRIITEVFRSGSMDYDYDNFTRLKENYDKAIFVINQIV